MEGIRLLITLYTGKSIFGYTIVAAVLLVVLSFALQPAFAQTNYGDATIEPTPVSIMSQYVEALTRITVTQPTVLRSVSLYMSYTQSDGSQCLKFGIYPASANGTIAGTALVGATQNGYCLAKGDWGTYTQNNDGSWSFVPAWETWNLVPSDYFNLNPGTYWLCILASESVGTIYHFDYKGAWGGQWYYNYGYSTYFFPASYVLGFPQYSIPLDYNVIVQPSNLPAGWGGGVNNIGVVSGAGPYSFYMSS